MKENEYRLLEQPLENDDVTCIVLARIISVAPQRYSFPELVPSVPFFLSQN